MRITLKPVVGLALLLGCKVEGSPLPDLVPVVVDAPSALRAPPNPPIQVAWGVTNQGNGEAAGFWIDVVYLSTRSNLDSSATVLGYQPGPGLVEPGGVYWSTNNVVLPIIQSGFYYLIVKANASENLLESNPNNNELAAGFTFELTPADLSPVSLVITSAVVGPPYPPVTVAWGVTNLGPGDALGYWLDTLYISSNAIFDSTAMFVTSQSESSLIPVGGSYWRTNTVRLPIVQSGTYYLFFKTDELNSLYESETNNNLIVAALNFNMQPPDLAPIALELPNVLTSPPNPQLTFVWGVTNQGSGAAIGYSVWRDALYFSTNSVWDNSAMPLYYSYEAGPVDAGDSYWRTNVVQVPVLQSGRYYFFLRVNASGNLLEAQEQNNNISAAVDLIIQPPDLAPLTSQLPSSFTGPPNAMLTLVWGVTNLGSGLAQGWPGSGWSDAVYLSTNTVLDGTAIDIGGSLGGGPLAAGGSYWHTNNFQMPVKQRGSYYLIFVTDSLNFVFESNKSNNIAIVPTTFIVTPPDLAPISLQVPPVVTGPPNPSFTIVWGVTNQGIGPAQMNNGAWWDALYFSTDAVLDPFDVALASQAESGPLAPGESYQRTNLVHLPVVSSTNGYLIFKTDVYDALYESNETNNTVTVPLTVNILPPDLAPIAFLAPNVVTSPPQPSLILVWGVTNQGTGVADPGNYSWSDSVYVSSNNVLDNTALLAGGWSESTPLPAGGSYWRTNGFTLPVFQSGTYYLFFTTDSSRTLYESDFGNNTVSAGVSFTIQPPDLAVLGLQASASITGPPKPSGTFVWGVTNQGIGSALGIWQDALFISSTPVFDNSATAVTGGIESGPLETGGTYWRTNTRPLPVTQSGNYYLFFQTDVGDTLYESDTNNNQVVLPIAVNILPPDLSPITLQVTNLVIGPPFPAVTLILGVTNLGPGAAIPDWYWQDRISLCTSPNAPGDCNELGSFDESQTVAAGDSYWRTNTIRVPVVASGTYYLRFDTDVNGALYESSVTNNSLTVPVTFQIQPPDLAPIIFQAPRFVTGPPYPQVKLSWGVTNQGTGSAIGNGNWLDRVYISTNPIIDPAAREVLSQTEAGPVTPGGNYWRSQTLSLPVDQSGSYYLIFVTDVYEQLYDANYTNNTVVVPITFNITPPDLVPFAFQAPATITGLEITNVTLIWGVTNQGTGTASAQSSAFSGWCDAVLLSTNPLGTWSDSQAFSVCNLGPLPPGGSYWSTNNFRFSVTQSGNYYFILQTDTGGMVPESNETNNSMVVPVTINFELPDLVPLTLQLSNTISGPPAPNVPLIYAVTNQGQGAALSSYPWLDQVYLSRTNVLDGTEIPLNWANEQGPVLPGDAYWRTNTIHVPVLQSGKYYFLLKTDVYNYLPESDESNNVVAVPVTFVIEPSDIAVIGFQTPSSLTGPPYPQLTFSWGVTNQGVSRVQGGWGWWQALFVSTVPFRDSNAFFVGAMQVTNDLPPGGAAWFTNQLTLPITTNGDYYLFLTVNDNNGLYEANTNNDLAVARLTYSLALPDLSPIELEAPQTLTTPPNPWVTISWGITNQGPGRAAVQRPTLVGWANYWSDYLWLSTSSNLDATFAFVSLSRETNSVPPSGSYWRTNTVQLPVTQSGSYYLILVANPEGYLAESDLSNNILAVPLAVTVTPPDLTPFVFQAPNLVTGQPYPEITVVWGVTNQGSGPALLPYAAAGVFSWPLVDALYVSSTPTLQNWDSAVAVWPRTEQVPPGTSYAQTNKVRLPISDSGNYYLIFQTDAYYAVTESDESNNSATLPITVRLSAPADLTALAFIAPRTITGPGNPVVTVAWHVMNQGLAPVTGSWQDQVYLFSPLQGDIRIGSSWFYGPLPVGGDYWQTNTVILPISQSGDYELVFSAGAGIGFYDLYSLDNSISVPITLSITGPPAVRLSDPQYFAGGSFRVSAYGALGTYYTLQGSDDFTNWSRVLDFVCAQDPMTLYDLQAGSFASRFYRIAPMTNSPVLRLDIGTPRLWTSKGVLLKLDGPVGAYYRIEASTDLLSWQQVTNFSTFVTPTYFVDPATNYVQKFYRTVLTGQ